MRNHRSLPRDAGEGWGGGAELDANYLYGEHGVHEVFAPARLEKFDRITGMDLMDRKSSSND